MIRLPLSILSQRMAYSPQCGNWQSNDDYNLNYVFNEVGDYMVELSIVNGCSTERPYNLV